MSGHEAVNSHGRSPEEGREHLTLCGRLASFSLVVGDGAEFSCGLCLRVQKRIDAGRPHVAKPERTPEERQVVELDDYQDRTSSTAIYPGSEMPAAAREARAARALPYLLVKLGSEAMEVGDAWAKHQRDGDGEMNDELRKAMVKELGDVMWYVAQIAVVLGHSLSWVAQRNLAKLASRKARGVLGGSGDDR